MREQGRKGGENGMNERKGERFWLFSDHTECLVWCVYIQCTRCRFNTQVQKDGTKGKVKKSQYCTFIT